MKYIKKFENLNEPKIGEYYLLDIEEMNNHNINKNWEPVNYPDNLAQFIGFNKPVENDPGDKTYFYNMQFYNGVKVFVRKEEILRPLTEDEIEEYENKKEALKYNL